MKKYVILTDTGSDLEKEIRTQYDIEYVPMRYSFQGKDYEAGLDWEHLSAKEFYDQMRAGERFITAQVNMETYKAVFKKYVEQGYDVLYVGTSSSISTSIKTGVLAAEEVMKEFPEAKIVCVDTLRACFALGILVIRAAELRAEGKTIEETADWLNENKLRSNMIGSVESLVYLKRAGRVSATSAFFGGLLNIKPIVIADAKGRNFAFEKVKGRKKSLERIAQLCKEAYVDDEHQHFFISHADCIEDAEALKQEVFKALGKEIDIHIGIVGSCVGSAVGPGMISVHFLGKKVTVNE